jgi:16S rRNA (guanine527-N7)-methyltransferase
VIVIEHEFDETLSSWGIETSDSLSRTFLQYYQELNAWNDKLNLTAISNKDDVYKKHFLDSISSCQVCDYSNQSIIDIGTGGGFPGLPLKIVFPELKVTFVDSSKKKISALKDICKTLGIEGCNFVSDNIENLGRSSDFRGKYQIAVTRAVSTISVLLEYGIPLLVEHGEYIMYKGPNVEKEVENSDKALCLLVSKVKKNIEFTIPFSDITRRLLVVEKQGKTPSEYPRKVGAPKKRPIQ